MGLLSCRQMRWLFPVHMLRMRRLLPVPTHSAHSRRMIIAGMCHNSCLYRCNYIRWDMQRTNVWIHGHHTLSVSVFFYSRVSLLYAANVFCRMFLMSFLCICSFSLSCLYTHIVRAPHSQYIPFPCIQHIHEETCYSNMWKAFDASDITMAEWL